MAGGFDEAFIAEVRSRSDIASIVSDYVTLRKAGHSLKGLCPFHGEKTPSFHVHPDRQFFYCFGCQAGGDVISFVKEINGYSFPEAVRHLADRAGLAVPEIRRDGRSPGGQRASREERREARDVFFQVNRLAMRFFVETLAGEHGVRCRAYLKERGVGREAAARFELGCAPDAWDGLYHYLQREGADLRAAEVLGLIVPRGEGRQGAYDRFRNRLMFPIRNLAGEVIGFSGRDLGESALLSAARSGDSPGAGPAKYVNSPESPIYSKGDQLYGLYEARQAMRRTRVAILVEGNLDLVRLHQAGVAHAVAPLGTALTGSQLRTLKRFVPRFVSLYDGDKAGREAARKAAHLALAEGVMCEVASLPEGSDPDSFVGAEGVEALEALLGKGTPAWEYLISATLAETQGTRSAQGARLTVEQLSPVLADVEDRNVRQLLESKLAHVLGLDVRMVRDMARQGARRRPSAPEPGPARPAPAREAPAGPVPLGELKLLELLIAAPAVRPTFVGRDGLSYTTHPGIRAALEIVLEVEGDGAAALAALPPGPVRSALYQRLTAAVAPPVEQAREALDVLMRGLRSEALEREVRDLRAAERKACLINDEVAAMRIMGERLQLERQLDEIRSTRG